TAGIVSMFHILTDPDSGKWSADLRGPYVKIRQDIYTPGLSAARSFGATSFLLVDLDSTYELPSIKLTANGVEVKNIPLRWLQLSGPSWGAERAYLAQAKAMGVGAQTFKQWWAIPVPTRLLRYDASNEFVLSSGAEDPLVGFRVNGDYKFTQPGGSEGEK